MQRRHELVGDFWLDIGCVEGTFKGGVVVLCEEYDESFGRNGGGGIAGVGTKDR